MTDQIEIQEYDTNVRDLKNAREDLNTLLPSVNITPVTGYHQAVVNQYINADCTGGAVYIVPPAANSGKSFWVHRVDATANTLTVAGVCEIMFQDTVIHFVYDGTAWRPS